MTDNNTNPLLSAPDKDDAVSIPIHERKKYKPWLPRHLDMLQSATKETRKQIVEVVCNETGKKLANVNTKYCVLHPRKKKYYVPEVSNDALKTPVNNDDEESNLILKTIEGMLEIPGVRAFNAVDFVGVLKIILKPW